MSEKLKEEERCPFYSRAYHAQCEKKEGHTGDCVSLGDGFAGGWDPKKNPNPWGSK